MDVKVLNFCNYLVSRDYPKLLLPHYVLVGRSNVGKSSLINYLLGRKASLVSSTPGATTRPQFFLVDNKFYLVDLPGFGYTKSRVRNDWSDYLLKEYPRKFLHLIDIRRLPTKDDLIFLEWATNNSYSPTFLFTKSDKLSKNSVDRSVKSLLHVLGDVDYIRISIKSDSCKKSITKIFL